MVKDCPATLDALQPILKGSSIGGAAAVTRFEKPRHDPLKRYVAVAQCGAVRRNRRVRHDPVADLNQVDNVHAIPDGALKVAELAAAELGG